MLSFEGTGTYTYLVGSFLRMKMCLNSLSFSYVRDKWEMILENFLCEHLGVKNKLNTNSY